jgi:hypothetical protein
LTKILTYVLSKKMGFIVELIFLSLGVKQKLPWEAGEAGEVRTAESSFQVESGN